MKLPCFICILMQFLKLFSLFFITFSNSRLFRKIITFSLFIKQNFLFFCVFYRGYFFYITKVFSICGRNDRKNSKMCHIWNFREIHFSYLGSLNSISTGNRHLKLSPNILHWFDKSFKRQKLNWSITRTKYTNRSFKLIVHLIAIILILDIKTWVFNTTYIIEFTDKIEKNLKSQ